MNEIDISGVEGVCHTGGSTHVMNTCKIGGEDYFLKFSDTDLFYDSDPSLQVLVEYLAYRIYGLFAGISIPTPKLVYDTSKKRVGIATSTVKGKHALGSGIDPKYLAKMLSQGVYVDIFLANWDVIGTGSGNVLTRDDKAVRIDPGGSLTFRAQGGKKGRHFGTKVGELETMLKGGMGAGNIYQYADLAVAAKEFLSIKWSNIESEIDSVKNEISEELKNRDMEDLLNEWDTEVNQIKSILSKRHKEVESHAEFVLETGVDDEWG